jgi:hypothetical protein
MMADDRPQGRNGVPTGEGKYLPKNPLMAGFSSMGLLNPNSLVEPLMYLLFDINQLRPASREA